MTGPSGAFWIGRMAMSNSGASGGGLSSTGEAILCVVLIGLGVAAIGVVIWALRNL